MKIVDRPRGGLWWSYTKRNILHSLPTVGLDGIVGIISQLSAKILGIFQLPAVKRQPIYSILLLPAMPRKYHGKIMNLPHSQGNLSLKIQVIFRHSNQFFRGCYSRNVLTARATFSQLAVSGSGRECGQKSFYIF